MTQFDDDGVSSEGGDLAPDLRTAVVEMFSDVLDDWLEASRRALNKRVREGCWCQARAKPCELHDAYDDGICSLIAVLQGWSAMVPSDSNAEV